MGLSAASKVPSREAGDSSPALHACGPCAADLTCGQQDVHHIGLAKQSGLMQSTALLRLESKRERRAGVVRTAAAPVWRGHTRQTGRRQRQEGTGR